MSEEYFSRIQVLAQEIQKSVDAEIKPASEIGISRDQSIIYLSMVRGTRGYIEKVSHQINGCYANAWYDSCAVMLRRLLETLIIECFEKHSIATKIKDVNGDYFYLKDLIDMMIKESAWTVGRNVKAALPRLKEIGDKSAHSRRFNAHREDIDKISKDIRDVVQELLVLANLK